MNALPPVPATLPSARAEPGHERPRRQAFFSPGVWVVTAVAAIGGAVWIWRMLFGLGAATHLTNAYPWGIWIGIDVACGVALAAGGFTTAFLAHILHREKYHAIVRPALLTAMLGYTFVALGVMTDLGRFWAMWHVMLPRFWQPNSVLFEVALCVMTYVSVLYIEFAPAVCERYVGRVRLPGPLARLNRVIDRALRLAQSTLGRFMTVFIIMGILLSCMHQSSLGTLMVIAQDKLHPFWQTPLLPLLFLLSAFSVGYPPVIFESIIAHRSFKLPGERDLLAELGKFIPYTLGIYFVVKMADFAMRGQIPSLFSEGFYSRLFLVEIGLGVIAPWCIFVQPKVRARTKWQFIGASLVVLGVAFNRLNVFLFAYSPLDPSATYLPSWSEVAVTAGFIATIVLLYRLASLNLPVIEQLEGNAGHAGGHGHAAAHAEPRRHPEAPQSPAPHKPARAHPAAPGTAPALAKAGASS